MRPLALAAAIVTAALASWLHTQGALVPLLAGWGLL